MLLEFQSLHWSRRMDNHRARTPQLFLSMRIRVATTGRTFAPASLRYKTTNTSTTTDKSATVPHRTTATPAPYDYPSAATNAATGIPEAYAEAPIDHATSAYSPVPSFPEDRGPDEPIDASITSGAPLDLQSRTVRIYKPTKAATQSGHWNGRQWRMDWDVLPRGHRWENHLMGWQSSADFMQGTHIFFKSKEDAIHFAEKQGYDWFVQEPNERVFRSKAYANNFIHSPKKLKIIRTK